MANPFPEPGLTLTEVLNLFRVDQTIFWAMTVYPKILTMAKVTEVST